MPENAMYLRLKTVSLSGDFPGMKFDDLGDSENRYFAGILFLDEQ